MWQINNTQLLSDTLTEAFRMRGVIVDIENGSVLLVNATLRNNGTRIRCLTGSDHFHLTSRSRTAVLTVFGE